MPQEFIMIVSIFQLHMFKDRSQYFFPIFFLLKLWNKKASKFASVIKSRWNCPLGSWNLKIVLSISSPVEKTVLDFCLLIKSGINQIRLICSFLCTNSQSFVYTINTIARTWLRSCPLAWLFLKYVSFEQNLFKRANRHS